MAMGSYFIGSKVRIPLHITEFGISFEEDVKPFVKSIITPDGVSAQGFPSKMQYLSQEDAMYYYDYSPSSIGDYIVIMTYSLDGVEYTAVENFTVNSKTNMVAAPRAESR